MVRRKNRFRIRVLILLLLAIAVVFNIKDIGRLFYTTEYKAIVLRYSEEYGIEPHMVFAIIKTESNFEENAVSVKEAKGLMQIMDDTGEWISEQLKIDNYNKNDLFKPDTNIEFGCWYLKNLSKEFDGNTDLVIAAYNAGSGNVKSWLKNEKYTDDGETLKSIPFDETDKYVKKVKINYLIYKYLYPEL